MLVDGRSIPLSLAASGSNVHDMKLLEPTLDAMVMPRPDPVADRPQHFCSDAGYERRAALETVQARDYRPHSKHRIEEAVAKHTQTGWKACRWVVERSHS